MNTLINQNYFEFEADFVEDNIRCIPMIVRFKLDACGVKLKLKQWSRMNSQERENLGSLPCETQLETADYKKYLVNLIAQHTGEPATEIPVLKNPPWTDTYEIPYSVQEKLKEFNLDVSATQWVNLSDLQRFALIKLSYPGHENRNFPKAIVEFGLC
jgi:hypothetical protein